MRSLFLGIFLLCGVAWASTDGIRVHFLRQFFADGKSSSELRMGKKYSFTGEILGVGPTGVLGRGFNLGFFLDPNSMVSMEIHGGNQNFNPGHLLGIRDAVTASSVGVHYKQFLMNTFYVKAGVDHRQVTVQYDSNSNSSSGRSFTGMSTVTGIAIGNQWQWNEFTMGCDWLGVIQPVTSQITDESLRASSGFLTKEEQENDKTKYVTGTGYTAIRFYLGASF